MVVWSGSVEGGAQRGFSRQVEGVGEVVGEVGVELVGGGVGDGESGW